MIGRHEGGGEENSIIQIVRQDLLEGIDEVLLLLFFSADQEEHIALHSLHEHSGQNLNVRIGFFGSAQVLLAVLVAGLELNMLGRLMNFHEVVEARDEVVELLHVCNRLLDAGCSPRIDAGVTREP